MEIDEDDDDTDDSDDDGDDGDDPDGGAAISMFAEVERAYNSNLYRPLSDYSIGALKAIASHLSPLSLSEANLNEIVVRCKRKEGQAFLAKVRAIKYAYQNYDLLN